MPVNQAGGICIYQITHLINVCPSSVEFVLKEAIRELGGVL